MASHPWSITADRRARLEAAVLRRLADGPRTCAELIDGGMVASKPLMNRVLLEAVRTGRICRTTATRPRPGGVPGTYRVGVYALPARTGTRKGVPRE